MMGSAAGAGVVGGGVALGGAVAGGGAGPNAIGDAIAGVASATLVQQASRADEKRGSEDRIFTETSFATKWM